MWKSVSPTFAIIHEYPGQEKIFHMDLYRLKSMGEAIDIGIEEYFDTGNYCFIEWAELVFLFTGAGGADTDGAKTKSGAFFTDKLLSECNGK